MKLTNIKEGKIYEFKNIDSLNDFCNDEEIIIKKVIDEDHIIVDFTNYKRPILVDATKGNIVISADEVRKAKN